jgi:MFS family permease
MGELIRFFDLDGTAMGHLTSAVQLGFIVGTLVFALLTLADRYSPSLVFLISAVFGAIFNLLISLESNTLISLVLLRFMTGFFLAGIYPVGMKIAADHFSKGLGKSLGYLVGALVVGTAFPHLLKELSGGFSWVYIIWSTSVMAGLGGLAMWLFVPDGPYRHASQSLDTSVIFKVFRNVDFRKAAFGYFGHMWELYAFWAFVPVLLVNYMETHQLTDHNVPLLAFLIIGLGGVACVAGGYLSMQIGEKRTALTALALSGICCLISPFLLVYASPGVFMVYLIFWGLVVIADSPMFSTLVARSADARHKGTALTIVNCIGFSITIVSIQLLNTLQAVVRMEYLFMFLAIGPIFGIIAAGGRAVKLKIN